MLKGKRVLAVVPARSGSKGIPHKNMRQLRGLSLVGWAGLTLAHVRFLDARIISTDSSEYAEEGKRYGLDAPFLRPAHLSSDESGAIEMAQHAVLEAERYVGAEFDVILIVEPTSPLRLPADIELAASRLIDDGADSVVTVSPLSPKSHPRKVLRIERGRLGFLVAGGNDIKARQALEGELYWRNGVCYALTRQCLFEEGVVFTENTLPITIARPIVNIDEPLELEWAEWLIGRSAEHLSLLQR